MGVSSMYSLNNLDYILTKKRIKKMSTFNWKLTNQESIKLMKVMNEFARCAESNGMHYEIMFVNVLEVLGETKLAMKTKSINKGFTTNRTYEKTFYPVLHWDIVLSDDKGFDFSLDQCTKTEYISDDGETLDNLM